MVSFSLPQMVLVLLQMLLARTFLNTRERLPGIARRLCNILHTATLPMVIVAIVNVAV